MTRATASEGHRGESAVANPTNTMNLAEIKDERVRRRIEAADARQNGVQMGTFNIQHSTPNAEQGKGPPKGGTPNKTPSKRLRQSSKPLLNKLELNFYARLLAIGPNKPIRLQAVRYRLGNGIWYKPDFTCVNWRVADGECGPMAWEVKGPRAFRGGFENLKVAAGMYPEVRFILVWRDKETKEWREQEVLS